MTHVLRGTRIVEQGTFITGPCAGMMLGDLGADAFWTWIDKTRAARE